MTTIRRLVYNLLFVVVVVAVDLIGVGIMSSGVGPGNVVENMKHLAVHSIHCIYDIQSFQVCCQDSLSQMQQGRLFKP